MDIGKVTGQSLQTMSETTRRTEKTADQGNTQNSASEIGDNQQQTKNASKNEYTAISRDGDTLELTDSGKEENTQESPRDLLSRDNAKCMVKMTDAELARCSKNKLKQLLQNGQISRQQYDKAMKKALS